MKCKACDTQFLNDYELSRKEPDTGEFLDLCGKCYTTSTHAMYNISLDVNTNINEVKGDSPWLTARSI